MSDFVWSSFWLGFGVGIIFVFGFVFGAGLVWGNESVNVSDGENVSVVETGVFVGEPEGGGRFDDLVGKSEDKFVFVSKGLLVVLFVFFLAGSVFWFHFLSGNVVKGLLYAFLIILFFLLFVEVLGYGDLLVWGKGVIG